MKLITVSTATTKIQTAVPSFLDYCISLLTDFSTSALISVQSVLSRHPEQSPKK